MHLENRLLNMIQWNDYNPKTIIDNNNSFDDFHFN